MIGVVFVLNQRNTASKKVEVPLPTAELIPTIDSSVIVDLLPKVAGKEVVLKIENIPIFTQSIEYSLSYETKKQSMQGVIGTVNITKSETSYEKSILLGTCSSGRCVYHEVVGPIKLSLKFSGSYGEKIFEKDFNL